MSHSSISKRESFASANGTPPYPDFLDIHNPKMIFNDLSFKLTRLLFKVKN